MKKYVGCSGYFYPEWKGIFYPENLKTNKWFEYYTEHFNTVEINSTFYRFPKEETLKRLYKKSPENFILSVKANRVITHIKKFKSVKNYLEKFYITIEKYLKDKLGCVLFQIPPSYHYSEENLEKILENLNFSFCNVLEFRHKSWWDKKVFNILKERKIVFCSINAPSLPNEIIKTSDIVYIRFHGKNNWYKYNYSEEELKEIVEKIIQAKPYILYSYFNNTAQGFAPLNALQFKQLLN